MLATEEGGGDSRRGRSVEGAVIERVEVVEVPEGMEQVMEVPGRGSQVDGEGRREE